MTKVRGKPRTKQDCGIPLDLVEGDTCVGADGIVWTVYSVPYEEWTGTDRLTIQLDHPEHGTRSFFVDNGQHALGYFEKIISWDRSCNI